MSGLSSRGIKRGQHRVVVQCVQLLLLLVLFEHRARVLNLAANF